MSDLSVDFLAEYNEMNVIPSKIAITYAFFDLFKVVMKTTEESGRGFYWCSSAVDARISDEVLVAFKAYIKAQKQQLKKCDVKGTNCGKMLWFFYHKLLEHNVFTVEVRRDILAYMDMCECAIMQ
jgi:hypothetical protein